jgi:16S rRNA (guanine527-N7)-methyltransferase
MSDVARPEFAGLPPGFVEQVGMTAERERDVAAFRERLIGANRGMNLVGESTLASFWARHFIDSAQLLWFSPRTRVWADLGSGAGIPGLILAILLKGREGAKVHLVESMVKRCRFLGEMVTDLGLPAEVHNARAETLRLEVEMVTARACAPLDRLLGYAWPFFERGARGLFLKGAEVEAELAEARKTWAFQAETKVSLSDQRGRVLSMREVRRAGPR